MKNLIVLIALVAIALTPVAAQATHGQQAVLLPQAIVNGHCVAATQNIVLQPQNIVVQPQYQVQPQRIVVQPQVQYAQPQNIVVQPQKILQPQQIIVQPQVQYAQPQNIIVQPLRQQKIVQESVTRDGPLRQLFRGLGQPRTVTRQRIVQH